jgi:hypothetical protein
MYQEIEDRWLSSNNDLVAFERDLRAYGGALFDELIPPDIQAPLWEVRDRLRMIQVVSEEPFIPWEVVHLKPPRQPGAGPGRLPKETRFLAQMGLTRWLHNRPPAAREISVRRGRAFYVVPDYPVAEFKLPEALEEIPFLKRHLHAGPCKPEINAVRDLLAQDAALDLFHFSGHGEAAAPASSQQTMRARLMLEGRVEQAGYVPVYLDDDTVGNYADLDGADGNRPLVVLNACQVGRAGWKLTSIGGFADAFIRNGAGAFVGTLWSVGDKPARHFTEGFYGALIEGKRLSEAALIGREAAKKAGEATWLAYVVYGHPEALVRMKRATPAPTARATEPPAVVPM